MAALPPGPRPSWEPDPPAPGAGAGAGTDALTVNALYPDGEPDWSSPQLDAAVLPEGLTRFRARRSTAPVLVVLGLVALVGSVVLLTTRGVLLGHVLRALGGALVPVAVTVGYLLWAARTARYRILVLVAFLWGTTELLAEYGLEDVVGQVRLSFLLPQVAVSPGLVGTPLVHALLTGAGGRRRRPGRGHLHGLHGLRAGPGRQRLPAGEGDARGRCRPGDRAGRGLHLLPGPGPGPGRPHAL